MNNYSLGMQSGEYPLIKEKSVGRGDFLIMLVLFIISGNPAISFGFPPQPFYVAVAVLFFFLMIRRNIEIVSVSSIGIFIFFAFILVYQSFAFSFFPVVTIFGVLVRLFIAYAAVRLVNDFARTYVDVIYALSLFSFLFYIPQQIGYLVGFDFPALFSPIEPLFGEPQGWRRTLFFHTYIHIPGMEYRNAGLFWEPGVLAGYLNLGIIFLASIKNQYDGRTYWKRIAVLSLCLLSTFSTMGYIVFPLAIMSNLLNLQIQSNNTTQKALRLLMSAYVIAIGMIVFFEFVWEQPFMKEKILNSIMVTQYKRLGWEADRIGTIFFDLSYIQERPLTGWGWHEDTRHSLHPFLTGLIETGRGNGMSDFTTKMGVPALLLWMYFVFKNLYALSGRNFIKSVVGLFCIAVILNGECYLGFPMFNCFFFLFRTAKV